jgi:hypothetical protein
LQQDVQERELSLIREYETKLLARQEEDATHDLSASTAVSESLGRISNLLRRFLRTLGGEDIDPQAMHVDNDSDENREPRDPVTAAEYALERDIELVRLEKENEELQRMMGVVAAYPPRRANSDARPTFEPPPRPGMAQRVSSISRLGGGLGTVGPSGTYKRMRSPG